MRTLLTSAVVLSALAIAPVTGMAEGTKQNQDTSATSATTKTEQQQNAGSGQAASGQSEDKSMAATGGGIIEQQKSQQTLSGSYIGSEVYTGSGDNRESVGEISELIFNENGEIEGAVVDVGGFLGLGTKPVGLRWDSLTKQEQQGGIVFTTSMNRADLENAPEFRTQEARGGESMTY